MRVLEDRCIEMVLEHVGGADGVGASKFASTASALKKLHVDEAVALPVVGGDECPAARLIDEKGHPIETGLVNRGGDLRVSHPERISHRQPETKGASKTVTDRRTLRAGGG